MINAKLLPLLEKNLVAKKLGNKIKVLNFKNLTSMWMNKVCSRLARYH